MSRKATRKAIVGTIAGAALMATGVAASAQTPLKVIVFPTISNLAQYAAQAQGYYSKRGLAVDLIPTPNSDETREGLAQGRYQIAHGGVDNAVAQAETDKVDLFVFMGGNNGFNSLIVQPEIRSYEDLRGKTMAVDSPVTAFAILMYKMLDVKGVKRSDFTVKAVGGSHARAAGLVLRAQTNALPRYPGAGDEALQGLQLLCTDRAQLARAHDPRRGHRRPSLP